MKLSWRTELPPLLLIAATFAASALSWGAAPARIPVHWGMSGEPDRFGGRIEGLLLLPLVGLAIYLLMTFLPRIDPLHAGYATFAGAYLTLRFAILALFTGIHAVILLTIRGARVEVGTVVPILVGALFLTISRLLARLEPNWLVGLRTPWALSSRRSWRATHRAGGKVFAAMGVVMMAMALVRPGWPLWTMIALVAAGPISLVIYSYRVWRDDPERQSPGREPPAP